MAMNKEAKVRPLYLAKILYERTDEDHYLTTNQLIRILEDEYGITSHRLTIKSDIAVLQDFGLDIVEVKSTQNRYNLVSRQFDVAELKLLIDAVVSSKFITKAKSEKLASKISALAGNYRCAELKRNMSCEGRIKPGNEKIYFIIDAINEAINQNKKISFQYFKYDVNKERKLSKNGESFVLTPLHLIWNGDYYYMIGVYDYQQRLGNFRLDRIVKRPTILDDAGTPAPEGFDVNRYLNTSFHMYGKAHKEVELVCDNDVMDAIIDRFGKDITTTQNDETSFRVTADVAVSHIFYSWVFGFGGKVKIKAPEDVKSAYEEMLRTALEKSE